MECGEEGFIVMYMGIERYIINIKIFSYLKLEIFRISYIYVIIFKYFKKG